MLRTTATLRDDGPTTRRSRGPTLPAPAWLELETDARFRDEPLEGPLRRLVEDLQRLREG